MDFFKSYLILNRMLFLSGAVNLCCAMLVQDVSSVSTSQRFFLQLVARDSSLVFRHITVRVSTTSTCVVGVSYCQYRFYYRFLLLIQELESTV